MTFLFFFKNEIQKLKKLIIPTSLTSFKDSTEQGVNGNSSDDYEVGNIIGLDILPETRAFIGL